jgi:hypothetical protein
VTTDSNESTLSRWSRLKSETREPAVSVDVTGEVDNQNSVASIEAEQVPQLTDADMPDIETLTEESDFSGFMSSGVSDDLRNLALRKLFKSSVFNIRDGLDEYDEDYTEFEKLGDIVTCDMKHRVEMEEQKLREKLAEEAEAAEAEAETEVDAENIEVDDDQPIAALDEEVAVIDKTGDDIDMVETQPKGPDHER